MASEGDPPTAGGRPTADAVESAFLGMLDALHQVLLLQEQLTTAMRQGWFNLARARYSMGAVRVGALQFPATMTATATLALSPGPQSQEAPILTLEAPEGSRHREVTKTADPVLGQAKEAEGLRRRKAPDESPDALLQGFCEGEEALSSGQRQRVANPLEWYGALVPPALREAQADFYLALSAAVELSNAILKLESFRRAYSVLASIDTGPTSPTLSRKQDVIVFEAESQRGTMEEKICSADNDSNKAKTRKPSIGTTVSTLMKEYEEKYGASL